MFVILRMVAERRFNEAGLELPGNAAVENRL